LTDFNQDMCCVYLRPCWTSHWAPESFLQGYKPKKQGSWCKEMSNLKKYQLPSKDKFVMVVVMTTTTTTTPFNISP
jgi:hypothetical protein